MKSLKLQLKSQYFIIPLLLFYSVFVVYLKTLAPTIQAIGDSGELITAAYVLGVPHAPGYPLYTMLGHLFTKLPIVMSVAAKVNLLSAVFHGLTIVFIYLAIKELLQLLLDESGSRSSQEKFLNSASALISTLVLAFSFIFWEFSIVAEVFALNNLFLALILWLLFSWANKLLRGLPNSENYLVALVFVYSLALTNHHSIILVFPFVFGMISYFLHQSNVLKSYFDFRNAYRYLGGGKIVLIFCIFLFTFCIYLYLPFSAQTNPPINWGNPTNLENLLRVITRADYGTLNLSPQNIPLNKEVFGYTGQIKNFINEIFSSTNIVSVGLMLLGLAHIFKKEKVLGFLFVLGIFLSMFIFLSAPNLPLSGVWQTVIKRFYLIPFIYLTLLLGLGIFSVFLYVVRLPRTVLGNAVIPGSLGFLLLLLLPIIIFLKNYPLVNRHNNTLLYDFALETEKIIPEKSLFLTYGENSWAALHYLKYVEGKLESIMLIDQAGFTYPWYRAEVEKNYPQTIKLPTDVEGKGNITITQELVKLNIDDLPIFTHVFFDNSIGDAFTIIPWGTTQMILPKDEEIDTSYAHLILDKNEQFYQTSIGQHLLVSDYPAYSYEGNLVENWSRAYARVGEFAQNYGYNQEAIVWFERAVKIWPQNGYLQEQLNEALYENKE